MIRFSSASSLAGSRPLIGACLLVACGLAVPALQAADNDLRIVPQLIVGTAGIEPGVALEWRAPNLDHIVLRPELSLSEDQRLGAGVSVLFDLSTLDLPHGHSLNIGPRFISHNSDDTGWEVDALATYEVALGSMLDPTRHALGVLGAVGLRDNKHRDETSVGASAGVFYSYRF